MFIFFLKRTERSDSIIRHSLFGTHLFQFSLSKETDVRA
ncbi:hypothetical protein D1AOALGA4SA_8343 [Olavius algarvensis Delta 1 endosymbiont]|nr:hypothetical protein D1AOALGA4SA_8343 [Olavius algarvensis Delta 1 endosymbiont]